MYKRQRITRFLKENDRFAKTIVFCVDIDHAERMRQALVNENSDLVAENAKYVMRITGDNAEGKAQLDYFIAEDSKYPVIVTTSKLMTTGVDCKTCRLIVLDNNINSVSYTHLAGVQRTPGGPVPPVIQEDDGLLQGLAECRGYL